MRVAIDLLLAEQLPGGMLLATQAWLNSLAALEQSNEYVIITGKPEDPCSPNARRAAASTFAARQCVPPKPPGHRGFVLPIAAVIAARVSGSSVDAPVTSSV